ncbi:hypothetical protein [Streptomyces sp. NPDC002690]
MAVTLCMVLHVIFLRFFWKGDSGHLTKEEMGWRFSPLYAMSAILGLTSGLVARTSDFGLLDVATLCVQVLVIGVILESWFRIHGNKYVRVKRTAGWVGALQTFAFSVTCALH